jgi:hypothetical protein
MGDAESLQVDGREHLKKYQPDGRRIESYFCQYCGSHLNIFMPDWPHWIYPFASVVDTPLPTPPEVFHVVVDKAVDWVAIADGKNYHHFGSNTEESIEM